MIKRVTAAFVLLLSTTSAAIALVSPIQEQPFPRFILQHGKLDIDGLPLSGAKLCILPAGPMCYTMPSAPLGDAMVYEFGLNPHSERHELRDRGSWVLFTAAFSGGGSGTLTRIALLRYSSNNKIEDLLPLVALADEYDIALWDIAAVSAYPLLVTAEPLWNIDHGEPHFGLHHQDMRVWCFDERMQTYRSILKYTTRNRYGPESESRSLRHPIATERASILKRLAATR